MVQSATADWCVTVVEAELTRSVEMFGKQDPYVVLTTQGRRLQTKVHEGAGLKPRWDQVFDVKVTRFDESVLLEVYDSGAANDEIIGKTEMSLTDFAKEGEVDQWVTIKHEGKDAGRVHFKSTFTVDNSRQIQADLQKQLAESNSEVAKLREELAGAKNQLSV